jgi:hypothetical protein
VGDVAVRPVLLLLLAACGSLSCSSPIAYTKAGAADDVQARDRYACLQESRVGSVVGGQDAVYFDGSNQLAQREANRLFDACMVARGYRRQ